jgi:hypothetical protein
MTQRTEGSGFLHRKASERPDASHGTGYSLGRPPSQCLGVHIFLALIASAKLCAVEPRAYLSEASRRAIRNPGAVTLPRDFK